MPKISEMQSPSLPLSGLEMVPALQGGGVDSNVGVPLLAYGHLPNGAVLKLRRPMVADLSSTTDADPGDGNVRWNNASPASATMLYIDNADSGSGAIDDAWAALQVGGFLYVQGAADSDSRDNWQKWQVTSVAAATGYGKVGVTLQSSNGAFADDDVLELTIQQPTTPSSSNRNVVTAISPASGTVVVDCSLGDYFTVTPTAAITGWSFINVPAACTINIILTQGATPYAVAAPSGLKWSGGAGTFSTAANKQDELNLSTVNSGGAWRAVLTKDFV